MSAIAVDPGTAEAADVSQVAARAARHQGKKVKLNLTGQYSIETPAGQVELDVHQRGKKLTGTANLADLDIGSLANLPFPLPIPIELPPIAFKGTFKKLTLNIDFISQVNLPVIGTPLFTITGNVTGKVQLLTGLVGHLTVNIGDNQVISTDFTAPLPGLP